MVRSLCPFAIETTFPLSNFKTKHIFGILMTLLKFLKQWGAVGALKFGHRRHPKFYFQFFSAAEGAAPLEGERNPAEGGCFASIHKYQYSGMD